MLVQLNTNWNNIFKNTPNSKTIFRIILNESESNIDNLYSLYIYGESTILIYIAYLTSGYLIFGIESYANTGTQLKLFCYGAKISYRYKKNESAWTNWQFI